MADLDDFFAKKDKKKSKKPKFLTPDELVKNLDDTSKKPKKPETSNNVNTTSSAGEESNGTDQPNIEEEWNEFEEEQRKDYTGLKIGQLTVNDDDDQSGGDEGEEIVDSDGNVTTDNRKDGWPWKKVASEEVGTTQIPVEKEIEKSKVYISPALRNSQGMASATRIKPRSRIAPDISNAEFFPSLGTAPVDQRKKKNEPVFEEVRHGGRVQRVQETAPPVVSATNRFQSLDEDDS